MSSAPRPQFGLDVMRKGGTLVVVGLYGGALSFPMPLFPRRAIAIRGSYVGHPRRAARGGRPPPRGQDPADSARRAPARRRARCHDDLRAGHLRGRVILKPDG
jgi:D-arabinose 1-dehydrogenase-like Zn-dependent alcohol dehydrogenase